MAYVSQSLKKQLAPAIKAVLKKYKMKGSIAVDNHSTLVVNLKSGAIDFQKDYNGVKLIEKIEIIDPVTKTGGSNQKCSSYFPAGTSIPLSK